MINVQKAHFEAEQMKQMSQERSTHHVNIPYHMTVTGHSKYAVHIGKVGKSPIVCPLIKVNSRAVNVCHRLLDLVVEKEVWSHAWQLMDEGREGVASRASFVAFASAGK